MKKLLFLDFESYYDSKSGYTLKGDKFSTVEYVRSPRFKAFGVGVYTSKVTDPVWISANSVQEYFNSVALQIGWNNIAVVGHNLKFDGFILSEIYKVIPGQYIDTLGMAKAVLGKTVKSHSLQSLAEYYGLQGKGIMETDGKETLTDEEEKALAEYCLHDVELCRDIYGRLAEEFPEGQYNILHKTIDMFVNPKLQLNVSLLEQTSKQEAERRANIFKEIGIEKTVFASNKKFPELLKSRGFEVPMKPSPKKKNADGSPMMIPALALGDVDFLEIVESENEELKLLCEARIASKSTLLETRSAKLARIGKTGLWSFDVQFSGADQTHRFSGGAGSGGNVQNLTRGSALRTAVTPIDGYSLVVGDFSQVEFRLVAYLSKDPGLIGLIEKGIDFYCDYASSYYGRLITKKDDTERRFGKEALLGLGYNMGSKKFKQRIKIKVGQDISDDDAWKAVDLYRTRYSRVPKLWEELNDYIPVMTKKDARLSPPDIPVTFIYEGFLLPSGLKVKFPNLRQEPGNKGKLEWIYDGWDKRRFEKRKLYGGKLLENICQALSRELTSEAMDKLDNVTGQVHDELHVICRKGLELTTAQNLKRVMSTSPSWMPQIKLEAEVGYGPNWGSAK